MFALIIQQYQTPQIFQMVSYGKETVALQLWLQPNKMNVLLCINCWTKLQIKLLLSILAMFREMLADKWTLWHYMAIISSCLSRNFKLTESSFSVPFPGAQNLQSAQRSWTWLTSSLENFSSNRPFDELSGVHLLGILQTMGSSL